MEPFAGLFICLLTGHLISDFTLQTGHDVANKAQPRVFAKHIFLTGLLAYLAPASPTMVLPALIVALLHGLVDAWKLWANATFPQRMAFLFVLDQVKHVVILAVVAWFFRDSFAEKSLWYRFESDLPFAVLVAIAGVIATTRAAGLYVGVVVQPYREQLDRVVDGADTPGRGLVRGGEIIGYLERLLILGFVLAGQFSAVGFLITAKSIFRFGELKDRENLMGAEYILIGTFLSFTTALLFSWLTGWALDAILAPVTAAPEWM